MELDNDQIDPLVAQTPDVLHDSLALEPGGPAMTSPGNPVLEFGEGPGEC